MLHIRTCNILCSVTSLLCFVACVSMPCIFLGFPLCFLNICQIAVVYKLFHRLYKTMSKNKKHSLSSFQDEWLSDPASRSWISKSKMLMKLVVFSARWILTFQWWEFQCCKAMLMVRSTKQELHRQNCEVLTSDTLLVTKRIPMIVGNLFLLLPLQLLKQHLPLLTWTKTYIEWMLKFPGAYTLSTVTAATTVVLNLSAKFQVMFPDSEIASQFTLGKTIARYTILYRIASDSRSSWYMTLMHLLFILFLLMRAWTFKCRWVKWMLESGIGIIERALLKFATTLTQNSWDNLMLTFYPKAWMNRFHHWTGDSFSS